LLFALMMNDGWLPILSMGVIAGLRNATGIFRNPQIKRKEPKS
jgi:hypothetical protein